MQGKIDNTPPKKTASPENLTDTIICQPPITKAHSSDVQLQNHGIFSENTPMKVPINASNKPSKILASVKNIEHSSLKKSLIPKLQGKINGR